MDSSKRTHKIIGLTAVALIVIGGTGAAIYFSREQNPPVEQSSDQEKVERATPADERSNAYKDGEYSASGRYQTPAGREEVTVAITLKDNTITNVSTSADASGDSGVYQRYFADGIKKEVIGKHIDEVSVSRVSGSSLTSTGFHEALTSIKDDAKG